ncbi:MAG: pyrroline-5-carboxylate reductase [Candidatus Bathyarchaeota archaeon B23]|nr:MAG: pyrroline-5-carboxylate reductase [Candidatus Bathyarchaeota archaeon B23]
MTLCVAVIGAGVIGGAIARRLMESRAADRVIATRRRVERLRPLEELGVEATRDNRWAAGEADVVFLCVKPNDVAAVLRGVEDLVEGKLVVSTAAIIPLSYYRSIAPGARYVRTMPNIAALVGGAFTAYACDEVVTEEDRELIHRLLSTLGTCEEVEEKYLDAITGLSGSGPAYIAIVIDALLYAGLKVGLPRELALRSSAQAVLGTAKLVLEGSLDTSKVKEMVTTPGGTTIEGIYQLEDSGIMTAFMRAVESATEKCRLLRERLGLE